MGCERTAGRFRSVTIASGDGMFAQAAAVLAGAGCHMTVVSRRAALSRQLALAVGWKVTCIDPPGARAPTPAARPPQAA